MAALQRTLRGPQLFQVTCKAGLHLGKNTDDGVQLRSVVRIGTDELVCEGGQQGQLLLRQGADGGPHKVPCFCGLSNREGEASS